MRNKTFLVVGIFILSSICMTQNSYLNDNENTKILKEILKEIEELKKGQDKLSKELTNLNKAQPSNKKPAVAKGGKKDVPVGNSMVLGKADAPITIIKWTDFQ